MVLMDSNKIKIVNILLSCMVSIGLLITPLSLMCLCGICIPFGFILIPILIGIMCYITLTLACKDINGTKRRNSKRIH